MDDGAQKQIVRNARTICEMVGTTVGPFGANKLIVQDDGTVTTTAVGSLALERLDVTGPAIDLVTDDVKSFHARHKDGSASVAVLLDALLRRGVDLRSRGLHPTVIERGYQTGICVATEEIGRRTIPLSEVGSEAVARTALTATHDPVVREQIGSKVADVANILSNDGENGFDRDRIAVLTRIGGTRSETKLVEGVVLDERPIKEHMPRTLTGTGVALISETVDIAGGNRQPGSGPVADVSTFEERETFAKRERETFRQAVKNVVDAGCRFLVTEKAVSERVETLLADEGVLAIHQVDSDDIQRLSRATGARVVPSITGLDGEMLGAADVAVRRKAGRDMIFVESANGNSNMYTFLVRAPDPRSADEFERSVESAISSVRSALDGGRVVPGGGAMEMAAAHAVRDHAYSIDSSAQMAVEEFADALTAIPRTLANNAGRDGRSARIRLHTAHSEGRHAEGVDAITAEIRDVLATDAEPIVDPAPLKRHVWDAATTLAAKFLRIDAAHVATDLEPEDGIDATPGNQATQPSG